MCVGKVAVRFIEIPNKHQFSSSLNRTIVFQNFGVAFKGPSDLAGKL